MLLGTILDPSLLNIAMIESIVEKELKVRKISKELFLIQKCKVFGLENDFQMIMSHQKKLIII
jgi:hypothetical protein